MSSINWPVSTLIVPYVNCIALYYLRRRLASREGIVAHGVTLSRCLCVRRIILGGEGNALYPVLSSCLNGDNKTISIWIWI